MSIFDTLTYQDALKRLTAVQPPITDGTGIVTCTVARRFFDGDHWQHGGGWVGQKPEPENPAAAAVLLKIRDGFISKNVIAEVVNRHTSGVAGREPLWRYSPRDGGASEQTLIDEAESAVTSWWDKRKPLLKLQAATRALLLGEPVVLRLFVPRGKLRDDERVVATTLDEALNYVYLDVVTNGAAVVVTDADTQDDLGLYRYTRDEVDYVDVTYLADDGSTVLRVLGPNAAAKDADPASLGGRLYLYALTRAALITPQVCQSQRAYNTATTQMLRNVNMAGSRERIIMNAQRPGQWTTDEATSTRVFVPGPFLTGPGVSMFLEGAPIEDANGNVTGLANPNIQYADPTPIDTFVGTREEHYGDILEEVQQLHARISGDATASGESRKQARAEYEASLELTKAALDDAGRWLLETVLYLASHFCGRGGDFAVLRADYNSVVNAGPLTADEETSIVLQVDKKLKSKESAMSLLGTDDVDSERIKIEAEADAAAARAPAPVPPVVTPPVAEGAANG